MYFSLTISIASTYEMQIVITITPFIPLIMKAILYTIESYKTSIARTHAYTQDRLRKCVRTCLMSTANRYLP